MKIVHFLFAGMLMSMLSFTCESSSGDSIGEQHGLNGRETGLYRIYLLGMNQFRVGSTGDPNASNGAELHSIEVGLSSNRNERNITGGYSATGIKNHNVGALYSGSGPHFPKIYAGNKVEIINWNLRRELHGDTRFDDNDQIFINALAGDEFTLHVYALEHDTRNNDDGVYKLNMRMPDVLPYRLELGCVNDTFNYPLVLQNGELQFKGIPKISESRTHTGNTPVYMEPLTGEICIVKIN
jgi:hypothetical protein